MQTYIVSVLIVVVFTMLAVSTIANRLRYRVIAGLMTYGLVAHLFRLPASRQLVELPSFFYEIVVTIPAAIVLAFAIGWLVEKLEASDVYFRFNESRIVLDRRVRWIVGAWFISMMVTSFMGIAIHLNLGLPTRAFYGAWVVDVAFFTLVSVAVAIVSLRLPHGESFPTRLSILFSGKEGAAVTALSDRVRALGLIASKVDREIRIDEYDPNLKAYRCEVRVRTTLVSLFGDVNAEDVSKFGVAPDPFDGREDPPEFGAIRSIYVEGEGERLSEEHPITRDAAPIPQRFTVGREPKAFVFEFWVWMEEDQQIVYNPSRFCEDHDTVVVNMMKDKTQCPRIRMEPKGHDKSLEYGTRESFGSRRELKAGEPVVLGALLCPSPRQADRMPEESETNS